MNSPAEESNRCHTHSTEDSVPYSEDVLVFGGWLCWGVNGSLVSELGGEVTSVPFI